MRFVASGHAASLLLLGLLSPLQTVPAQIPDTQGVLNQNPAGGGGGSAIPDTGSLLGGDKLSTVTGAAGGLNGLLNGLGLNNLDLSTLLDIDWQNDKDLLNIGGQHKQSKLNVLSQKPNATDEEKAAMMREEVAKNPQGKALLKAKEDEKNGRLNFFYCYGMQSEGDVVRVRWVMLFDNAFTAIRYFQLVQKSYKEYYERNRNKCKEYPTPQMFIFPHGVGPDQLEKTKEFTEYTGKVFVTAVDAKGGVPVPVIPHQDVFGFLPSRWSP
ncbi:hypothetical protein BJX61DRAFT_542825 [Aspergillus egyptiacus]|nr:hypothetical protein BJX61DRAFT_542825 [Aspergillus egyptiacus]